MSSPRGRRVSHSTTGSPPTASACERASITSSAGPAGVRTPPRQALTWVAFKLAAQHEQPGRHSSKQTCPAPDPAARVAPRRQSLRVPPRCPSRVSSTHSTGERAGTGRATVDRVLARQPGPAAPAAALRPRRQTYGPLSACTYEPQLPTILSQMARPVSTAGTGPRPRPCRRGPDRHNLSDVGVTWVRDIRWSLRRGRTGDRRCRLAADAAQCGLACRASGRVAVWLGEGRPVRCRL